MATITDMIRCPKCGKRMMGKSHPQKWGMEYFAHCCHQYFGTDELIHQWGYDAGDLFGYVLDVKKYVSKLTEKYYPSRVKSAPINFFSPTQYDEETEEPYWLSGYERNDAYQMVNRMFQGIEEFNIDEEWGQYMRDRQAEHEEYLDYMETLNDALQIGLQ